MSEQYKACKLTRALLEEENLRSKILDSIGHSVCEMRISHTSNARDVVFLENGCEITLDIGIGKNGVIVESHIDMPGAWSMDWLTFCLKNLPQSIALEIYEQARPLYEVVEMDFLKKFTAKQMQYGKNFKNLETGIISEFNCNKVIKSTGDRITYFLGSANTENIFDFIESTEMKENHG